MTETLRVVQPNGGLQLPRAEAERGGQLQAGVRQAGPVKTLPVMQGVFAANGSRRHDAAEPD